MILGIDSSAITAGCALWDNGRIVAEEFLNTRHTHSQTLLPMVESMLKNAQVTLREIDAIAVTTGPGSFTGLRIGVSAVKGMAFGTGKQCIPVSTLEAIAHNFAGMDCIVCACMDARCSQVYNALFRVENGRVERLCDDRALKLSQLSQELSEMQGRIILAGDGAEITDNFTEHRYELAPEILRFQRGSGVCAAAQEKQPISAAALMPSYLRLPQAERERLAKENAPSESSAG
ncbi:MAG: tRNA (adenosine(37)-N6)-threonylcarbamoyltransferase complex dimerization subunit type 1 TsaB [Oscillospiraceae bacterium]